MRKLVLAAAVAAFALPAAAQDNTPMIDVTNAKIEGNMITGLSVTIDQPGYLVIHNDGEGAPPNSLGHVAVEPGAEMDVSIEADAEIDPATAPTVMLHYETNDNDTYDFGPDSTDVDTPVMVDGEAIVQPVGSAM